MRVPHHWPHTSIPDDLDGLLRVAARTGATLGLRGDVAQAIWRSLDRPDTGSIFDAIPPLAPFEVGVFPPANTGELSADALREIQRELPWAGFFGLRRARPKRGTDCRLVRLTNEPRVLILPDARSFGAAMAAQPAERLLAIARDGKGQVLIETTPRAGPRRVEWRDSPHVPNVNAGDALHDLIYLATEIGSERPTPADMDDRLQVIDALSSALKDGQRVRDSVKVEDPGLQLALLRYLTQRTEAETLHPTAKNVLVELSTRLPATLIARLTEILTTRVPFRAIVLPQPDGSRAVKEVMSNKPLTEPVPCAPPWIDVANDASGEGLSISDPVVIDAPQPDPCCRYRDFSRGIAEIVWSTGPRIAEQRLPIVFLPDDGEFTFGSGYFSVPDAASLRLDYGFLGYLRGRAGRVEVAAAWKTEPPGEEPATRNHGNAAR
jgi:hypothetical protein